MKQYGVRKQHPGGKIARMLLAWLQPGSRSPGGTRDERDFTLRRQGQRQQPELGLRAALEFTCGSKETVTPVELSALGLGGKRRGGRWGWEEGDESRRGSPWEQPAPKHLSDKHTHPLGKSSWCEGAGGNCRRLLGSVDCLPLRLEEEESSKSGWC